MHPIKAISRETPNPFVFWDSERISALIKTLLCWDAVEWLHHHECFPTGRRPKWHLEHFSDMSDVLLKMDSALRPYLAWPALGRFDMDRNDASGWRLHQLEVHNVFLGELQLYDEQLMYASGSLQLTPALQSRCDDFMSQRHFTIHFQINDCHVWLGNIHVSTGNIKWCVWFTSCNLCLFQKHLSAFGRSLSKNVTNYTR